MPTPDPFSLAIVVAAIALALCVIWIFTRQLDSQLEADTKEDTGKRVRSIIFVGYISILVMLSTAILPFMVFEFGASEPDSNAPIQILKACPAVNDTDGQGSEQLHCPPGRTQWAVSIGGIVQHKTVAVDDAHQEVVRSKLQAVFENAGTKTRNAIQNVAGLPDDERHLIANSAAKTIQEIPNDFELKTTFDVPVVSGGLVVPLYLIVVALIGGCIGMARRLPEFQMRGAPGYKIHYEVSKAEDPKLKRPLEAIEVREYVVFQVMQVVFAPFLAVVAYTTFKPVDISAGVAIGFVSGFASEPLLLQIRKLADATSKLSSAGDTSTVPSTQAQNPKPEASGLKPQSVQLGAVPQSVVIAGTSFSPNAEVLVEGERRPTTVKGDKEAEFELEAKDVATAGQKNVTISNPKPGGGESAPLPLEIVT